MGFDLPALLEAADVLGYDRTAMTLLLPYGEAGFLEAVREQQTN